MRLHNTALGNEDATFFRDTFRRVCSHLPSGVTVLTSLDEQNHPFGLTLSSMAWMSEEPPLLSVAVARCSLRIAQLRRVGRFAVHILAEHQADLAAIFATAGDRFSGVSWHTDEFGPAILDGTLGVLLCELWRELEAGDHQLIVGEVKELRLAGGKPLVYWRRAFHRLAIEYPFTESREALEEFVERWQLGTLPKRAWTHGAHVAVAAYFTFDHPADAAIERIKAGIRHFNDCVGTPNTETSGYHETLTRFWSQTVGEFVRAGKFASRFEAVREAVNAFGCDRDRHAIHYSFDVLNDLRARLEWVPPDRTAPQGW